MVHGSGDCGVEAEPRCTRGGQPRYSAMAITTALTLRAVFRLALRQTEGLVASLLRLLGLDLAAPDHTTISRRGETLPVSRPRPGVKMRHRSSAEVQRRGGAVTDVTFSIAAP